MATNSVSSVFSRGLAGVSGVLFNGRLGGGRLRAVWALAAVFLLAQAGWAQTINMSSPGGAGVTISGDDVILGSGANNATITGSASGKRLIIDAAIAVTFNNLTLTGDMYSAVSIGAGTASPTGRAVTINLVGNNTLIGGIGGAGLRVPSNSTLTINGTGSLTAIGGQWRSLIGTDAGAGIGGGNTTNTGGTATGNLTDHCGTVIINSGTIYAYGGASGQSTTDNAARFTTGAGIGGSGNIGNGCTLTINGGNVTAIGGKPGVNDIGPGIRYWGSPLTAVRERGTNGTIRINGGSVNATVTSTATSTITSATTVTRTTTANAEIPSLSVNGSTIASMVCNKANCEADPYCAIVTEVNTSALAVTPRIYCDVATSSNCGRVYVRGNNGTTYQLASNNNLGGERCAYVASYVETTTITTNANAVQNSATTPQNLTKRTIKIGASTTNTETQNKAVTACRFGNPSVNCATTADATGNVYGINDVKTDGNGQVYFWLRSATAGNITTADTIKLDIPPTKGYGYSTTASSIYTFSGPHPTLTVPPVGPYSLVDGSTITGPYRTGFRMAGVGGLQHVAAVGREITIYKGSYNANDASATEANGSNTRFHTVRWCRAATNTQTTCGTPTTEANDTYRLHSGRLSTTYTPQPADYGQYIWAEVIVRDNSSTPANNSTDWTQATKYPTIQVGAAVIAEAKLSSPSLSQNNVSFNLKHGYISTMDTLFIWDLVGVNGMTVTSGARVVDAMVSYVDGRNMKYSWTARWNGTAGTGQAVNLSSSLTSPTTDASVKFTLPTSANFTLPTSGDHRGFIILEVDMTGGDIPILSDVEICHGTYNASFACSSTESTPKKYNYDPATFFGNTLTKAVPGTGAIKLKFTPGFTTTTLGSINLDGSSIYNTSNCRINTTTIQGSTEVMCNYEGLDVPGKSHTLQIAGWNNTAGPMNPYLTYLRSEQKATAEIVGNLQNTDANVTKKENLKVGDNVLGRYETNPYDEGVISKISWYFEVSPTSTKPGDGVTFAPTETNVIPNSYKCFDDADANCSNFSQAVTGPTVTLLPAHFTRYVRLVIRADGSDPITATGEGQVKASAWVPVGVLLAPAPSASVADGTLVPGCYGFSQDPGSQSTPATDQEQCRTYSFISIGACNPKDDRTINSNPNCTSEGLYVYDYSPYMLSAPTRSLHLSTGRMDYKLDTWKDDASPVNTCTSSTNAFDCGSFYQYTVPTNPVKGKYTISPEMIEWIRPSIKTATIKGGDTDDPTEFILKTSDGKNLEGTNISIYNNIIEVDFGDLVSNESQSILITNTTTQSSSSGSCVFDGVGVTSGMACKITLATPLIHDNGYRVEIKGFASLSETMDTEVLSFRTGLAPSFSAPIIRNVENTWYSNVHPNSNSNTEKFAVGKSVTVKAAGDAPVEYKKNGGGALSSWSICLETEGKTDICTNNSSSTETEFNAALLTYSQSLVDYGKNVRITISGKHTVNDDDIVIAPVSTAWVPVGVVVNVDPKGLCKDEDGDCAGSGKPSEGALGALSYRVEGANTTPRIVYDSQISVRFASDVGTDKFNGWTATGGSFTGVDEAITEWIPGSVIGEVTLSASMTDGRPLNISAALNNATTSSATGFVFTFSPSTDRTILKGTGNITINDGTNDFHCNVASTTSGEITTITGATAAVPFACFKNSGASFAVVDGSGSTYILSIANGVFKDGYNNVNTANPTLYNFNSAGATYVADLGSKSSIIKDKIYNGNTTFTGEDGKITLTNVGTGVVRVENYCLIEAGLSETNEATAIANCASTPATNLTKNSITVSAVNAGTDISKDGTATFTVVLGDANVKIDANGYAVPYRANLIIKVSNGQTFKVPVSYTVNKATITLTKYPDAVSPVTYDKQYDGTNTAFFSLAPGANSWNSSPTVSGLTVSLLNSAGQPLTATFDNEHAGAKQVAITYKLTGTNSTNYAFANGRDEENSVITAEITKLNVNLSFGGSNLVGTKPYNGSNEFENPPAATLSNVVPLDLASESRLKLSAAVYLVGANASDNQKVDQVRVHLTGTHANNYNLATPVITDLYAKISPKNLAYIANTDKTRYGNNCVVVDAVEYGTKISELVTLRGRTALTGGSNCPVVDNGDADAVEPIFGTKQTVMGNWTVCTKDANIACNAIGAELPSENDNVGSVADPRVLYAYYKVETADGVANFANDLVVKVNLTVTKKNIYVGYNLGAGNGVKQYDGTNTLSGVKAVTDDEDLEKCLVANATYENGINSPFGCREQDACSGKMIKIIWGVGVAEGVNCAALVANYNIDPVTSSGGIIEKRLLHIVGTFTADFKYYDGTATVTEFVGDGDLEIDPIATIEGVSLSKSSAQANFVSPDVILDGNGNPQTVPIVLTQGFELVVLNPSSYPDTKIGNYTLAPITVAGAVIRPISLEYTGGELYQVGTYGSPLTDIRITTAGTYAFPSSMPGINSTTVSGFWEWVTEGGTDIGNATVATAECPPTSDAAAYSKGVSARFRPQGNNYNPLTHDVKLCVAPQTLNIAYNLGDGNGVKKYDGFATVLGVTPASSVKEDIRVCLESTSMYVDTDLTDDCEAKDACSGKTIEIDWTWKTSCSDFGKNYIASPTTIPGVGVIQPMELTVFGVTAEPKDYDGTTALKGFSIEIEDEDDEDKPRCWGLKDCPLRAAMDGIYLKVAEERKAYFVSPDVRLGQDGQPIEVAIVLDENDFTLGSNNEDVRTENYKLAAVEVKGVVISPVELKGKGGNDAIVLRQAGTYGSPVTDIRITTNPTATYRFPSTLDGVEITTSSSSSLQVVSGFWEWLEGSVGDATVDAVTCPLPTAGNLETAYSNTATAKFTAQGNNYLPLFKEVSLCVARHQLAIGNPTLANAGGKVYDGNNIFCNNTSAYPCENMVVLNDNWKTSVPIGKENDANSLILNVKSAIYTGGTQGYAASTGNEDYRILEVAYELDRTNPIAKNYHEPAASIYRSAIISKRIIPIYGLEFKTRQYTGENDAELINTANIQAGKYCHEQKYCCSTNSIPCRTDLVLVGIAESCPADKPNVTGVIDKLVKASDVCPNPVAGTGPVLSDVFTITLLNESALDFRYVDANGNPDPNASVFTNDNVAIPKKVILSSPTLEEAFKLVGVNNHNYAIQLPDMGGIIDRLNFADYICTVLGMPESERETCLQKWLEQYRASEIPLNATYGQSLGELTDSIARFYTTDLSSLFDNEVILPGGNVFTGTWVWTNPNEELLQATFHDNPSAAEEAGWPTQYFFKKVKFIHSRGNYEPIDGMPVPIRVHKKPLTINVSAEGRYYNGTVRERGKDCNNNVLPNDSDYDTAPWSEKLCPGKTLVETHVTWDLLDRDKALCGGASGMDCLPIEGNVAVCDTTFNGPVIASLVCKLDPYIGYDKPVLLNKLAWASGTPNGIKFNYLLPGESRGNWPVAGAIVPSKERADNGVNIIAPEWRPEHTPDPNPQPREFVYDETAYSNLASVRLTSGWNWLEPDLMPANPHDPYINPSNSDRIEVPYWLEFTPPDTNYTAPRTLERLTIIKRNEDFGLKSAPVIAGKCGSDTARVTILTANDNATVWYQDQRYDNKQFSVSGLPLGYSERDYTVQAQAYGISRDYTVGFHRLPTFELVASQIREKAWTVQIDSALGGLGIDPLRTQWYKDVTLKATGRNLSNVEGDITGYWVKLFDNQGKFVISSCTGVKGFEGGNWPDLEISPVIPQQKVNIVASSFSSKVVAGGTALTLNTPFGGTVSIYTMKGQLVSKINAVESRTVVRVPSTQGMYIVKLEAK